MKFDPADIRRVLSAHPEIELAYLFGSRANGTARSASDVDIGVSADTPDLSGLKLALLEELALAGCEKADLTFFQQATPFMRYQMVRPNKLLYRRSDVDAGRVFSRCLDHYFDLEPTLRVQREAYKRRILHG